MKRWFLLVGLAGCSITLSGPDPNRPRNKAPQCDNGKGLVALDAVLGATAGVIAIAAAGDEASAAVVPAALGVALIAAAVRGNSIVDDCRKANDEYLALEERTPLTPIAAETPEPPLRRVPPPAQPRVQEPHEPDAQPQVVAAPVLQPAVQPPPAQQPPAQQPPAQQPPAQQPPAQQPPAQQPPVQPLPWAAFWKEIR